MSRNTKSRQNKNGNRKVGNRNKQLLEMKKEEMQEHPPQIDNYQVTHSTVLRFTSTAASAATVITFADLLDCMLVATTTVAASDLFDLVKVKKIRVWGQAALGTPSTVELSFNSATGDGTTHTDTSLGVKPAFINCKPSPKTLASFWQPSTGGNCFSITCPAGSIVDVHLVYKSTSANPTASQAALVAAVPGEFYWRGLDGIAIAATNFPPPGSVPSR